MGGGEEEREGLNLPDKDMFIMQGKSDISSSSTKNGKYKNTGTKYVRIMKQTAF